jgi:hypothetical protein
MKTLEETCIDLASRPKFAQNILIGTALGLVPILNLLSLGYLAKFGRHRREDGTIGLPDWQFSKKWFSAMALEDFRHSLCVLIEFCLTAVAPTVGGYVLFGIIGMQNFGMCLGLFCGAPAFAYATMGKPADWHNHNSADVLRKIAESYRLTIANFGALLVPSALFLFLQIEFYLLFPRFLYGVSLFIGFVFLIAHVRELENWQEEHGVNMTHGGGQSPSAL